MNNISKIRACMWSVALVAAFCLVPGVASATDTVYMAPMSFGSAYETQLEGWIGAFFTTAFKVFIIVVNAGVVFWFCKMAIKRVFRLGRA